MGTPRGSSRSRLVVDNTVWPSEAAGEEAVLAEFADETARSQAEPASTPTAEPEERRYRGLRLLSPHTPMKEVVRTVLVGCLSAMALGASFAIGFGYVWSDLSVLGPPAEIDSTAGALPRGGGSSLPLPTASPPASTETPSVPAETAPPTEVARSSTPAVRGPSAAPRAPTSAPLDRRASTPATRQPVPDPGPAFGVAVQRPSSAASAKADARASSPPVPDERRILTSQQPMLSAEGARVAETVTQSSPSFSVTPNPTRAAETGESIVSAAHRAELDAVRQAIARYQTAYSQKDVGAMALVWPSVDVAGVARAFGNVDRQALTFNDCRVTTAGKFATAVCPGQVRYIGRVGGRQMQERHGTWTIALERNGEAWQFTRLNVR